MLDSSASDGVVVRTACNDPRDGSQFPPETTGRPIAVVRHPDPCYFRRAVPRTV